MKLFIETSQLLLLQSIMLKNVLTSSVNGVENIIYRQLLSNLSTIPNEGNTNYLNYYVGLTI